MSLIFFFCIFNLLNFFFKRKSQDYFLFLDKELSVWSTSTFCSPILVYFNVNWISICKLQLSFYKNSVYFQVTNRINSFHVVFRYVLGTQYLQKYIFFPFSNLHYDNLSTTRRRQWHPTPVLLPGKSHGRRSLVGCSPWGR